MCWASSVLVLLYFLLVFCMPRPVWEMLGWTTRGSRSLWFLRIRLPIRSVVWAGEWVEDSDVGFLSPSHLPLRSSCDEQTECPVCAGHSAGPGCSSDRAGKACSREPARGLAALSPRLPERSCVGGDLGRESPSRAGRLLPGAGSPHSQPREKHLSVSLLLCAVHACCAQHLRGGYTRGPRFSRCRLRWP